MVCRGSGSGGPGERVRPAQRRTHRDQADHHNDQELLKMHTYFILLPKQTMLNPKNASIGRIGIQPTDGTEISTVVPWRARLKIAAAV
jgi:hypothetical protein